MAKKDFASRNSMLLNIRADICSTKTETSKDINLLDTRRSCSLNSSLSVDSWLPTCHVLALEP